MKKLIGKMMNSQDFEQLVEDGQEFIKNLADSERVLLLHHSDIDGYSSAALFIIGLKKLNINNVDAIDMDVGQIEPFLETEKAREYDKIIIVDIDIPQLKGRLNGFDAKLLILDHHIPRKNLNGKNIIYINPRFKDEEIYQPASYVSYKFLSGITDMKEHEWLAVLGTAGDYAYEDCRDLMDKWTDAREKDDVPKTEFWRVGNILYSAILLADLDYKESMKPSDILKLLVEARGLDDIKSDYRLKEADRKFGEIYEATEKEFWKNSEEFGDIIISTIRPSIKKVGGPLITRVSTEHKDKIIFLLEKRGDIFKIHARYQLGTIHLGKLMEKFGIGGGHRHAAGGSIKITELKPFKERLIKELSSLRK